MMTIQEPTDLASVLRRWRRAFGTRALTVFGDDRTTAYLNTSYRAPCVIAIESAAVWALAKSAEHDGSCPSDMSPSDTLARYFAAWLEMDATQLHVMADRLQSIGHPLGLQLSLLLVDCETDEFKEQLATSLSQAHRRLSTALQYEPFVAYLRAARRADPRGQLNELVDRISANCRLEHGNVPDLFDASSWALVDQTSALGRTSGTHRFTCEFVPVAAEPMTWAPRQVQSISVVIEFLPLPSQLSAGRIADVSVSYREPPYAGLRRGLLSMTPATAHVIVERTDP